MKYALFALILLQSSNSFSEIHVNLRDITFLKVDNVNVRQSNINLEMKIFYSKNTWNRESYSKDFVKSVARSTIFHLKNFMKLKGLEIRACGLRPQRLHIYVVSSIVLNDRRRFSIKFLENKYIGNEPDLIGYYDPTHYDFRTDSIIITHVSDNRNNSLLAHEISHYFYNRFCINIQTMQNTEPFAVEFEDYYSRENSL